MSERVRVRGSLLVSLCLRVSASLFLCACRVGCVCRVGRLVAGGSDCLWQALRACCLYVQSLSLCVNACGV